MEFSQRRWAAEGASVAPSWGQPRMCRGAGSGVQIHGGNMAFVPAYSRVGSYAANARKAGSKPEWRQRYVSDVPEDRHETTGERLPMATVKPKKQSVSDVTCLIDSLRDVKREAHEMARLATDCTIHSLIQRVFFTSSAVRQGDIAKQTF